LDAKFPLEILDLCLGFIKFTIEKADPYPQVGLIILESLPVTEVKVSFKLN
jgi:hypothetical protein